MPATTFPEYVQHITNLLNHAVAAGEAVLSTLQVDQRSAARGPIAGIVQFGDGAELHFHEYVDVTQAEPKIMCANHYQDVGHNLIFRYDNVVHRPTLPQLEHRHTRSGVEASSVPTLAEGLDHILR
jgi:hypothetical protein